MIFFPILLAALTAQADLVVLDNGNIRIEVIPGSTTVRYAGFAGGINFLDAGYAFPESGSSPQGMGGLFTRILIEGEGEPAFSRGPSRIIEQSKDHVVLLRTIDAQELRLKTTLTLHADKTSCTFSVTVFSLNSARRKITIRNESILTPYFEALPIGGTAAEGEATGEKRPKDKSGIPLAHTLEITGSDGTWWRSALDFDDLDGAYAKDGIHPTPGKPGGHGQVATMQGRATDLRPGAPFSFTEVWNFEPGLAEEQTVGGRERD